MQAWIGIFLASFLTFIFTNLTNRNNARNMRKQKHLELICLPICQYRIERQINSEVYEDFLEFYENLCRENQLHVTKADEELLAYMIEQEHSHDIVLLSKKIAKVKEHYRDQMATVQGVRKPVAALQMDKLKAALLVLSFSVLLPVGVGMAGFGALGLIGKLGGWQFALQDTAGASIVSWGHMFDGKSEAALFCGLGVAVLLALCYMFFASLPRKSRGRRGRRGR